MMNKAAKMIQCLWKRVFGHKGYDPFNPEVILKEQRYRLISDGNGQMTVFKE